MAQSKHLELRSAVAMLFAAVAGGRIHQNRQFNLAKGVDSQVHVNFRRATPQTTTMYSGHPIDWVTVVEIVILARKVDDQEAGAVADSLWVECYGLVMSNQQLGGLADFLEPGEADTQEAEADTTTCRLTWSIAITHRTDSNSISS